MGMTDSHHPHHWGIVQLVERAAVNRYVVGSSPTTPVEWVGNIRFIHMFRDHHIRNKPSVWCAEDTFGTYKY